MRDQLVEGFSQSFTQKVEDADVVAFAGVSRDNNPVHLDDAYAATTKFKRRIAHGMLSASFISTVLGTKLPGPGAIYLRQNLNFVRPVFIGDEITATVTVRSYDNETKRLVLDTVCTNQSGKPVITGEAEVLYDPPGTGQ